jgi:hypothetical protein
MNYLDNDSCRKSTAFDHRFVHDFDSTGFNAVTGTVGGPQVLQQHRCGFHGGASSS